LAIVQYPVKLQGPAQVTHWHPKPVRHVVEVAERSLGGKTAPLDLYDLMASP
jgi:hypothetical protein